MHDINKIDEKVVSMVIWGDKCMVATEHHIYELVEGKLKPIPFINEYAFPECTISTGEEEIKWQEEQKRE